MTSTTNLIKMFSAAFKCRQRVYIFNVLPLTEYLLKASRTPGNGTMLIKLSKTILFRRFFYLLSTETGYRINLTFDNELIDNVVCVEKFLLPLAVTAKYIVI